MIGYQSQGYGRLARPLYSFAEADRLAGVTRGTSGRWLKGYWYTPEERRVLPPITPDPSPREAVSFIDLVEVVAIGKLRERDFSLRRVRQLNFLQHVKTLLEINGRCAIVVPDNVLFEGGAGETVRRKLLQTCDVHTLLRLPTGTFYAQGVKANVLFFDKRPAREGAWTSKLWVYDLRTNAHFTLKQNPLRRHHLDEFLEVYTPADRHNRRPTWSEETPDGRWRSYVCEDLLKRDKVNLDLFWLRDESLEDAASLPEPDVIAEEIAEDLQSALDQFAAIANDLGSNPGEGVGTSVRRE